MFHNFLKYDLLGNFTCSEGQFINFLQVSLKAITYKYPIGKYTGIDNHHIFSWVKIWSTIILLEVTVIVMEFLAHGPPFFASWWDQRISFQRLKHIHILKDRTESIIRETSLLMKIRTTSTNGRINADLHLVFSNCWYFIFILTSSESRVKQIMNID